MHLKTLSIGSLGLLWAMLGNELGIQRSERLVRLFNVAGFVLTVIIGILVLAALWRFSSGQLSSRLWQYRIRKKYRNPTKLLHKAGWFPGRVDTEVAIALDYLLHEKGRLFFREFGGLNIDDRIIVDHADHLNSIYREHREHLKALGLDDCIPIASSWYWDFSHLWMDPVGQIFLVDDYEVQLLGPTTEAAIQRLLSAEPLPASLPKWQIPEK